MENGVVQQRGKAGPRQQRVEGDGNEGNHLIDWDLKKVEKWLQEEGFSSYIDLFIQKHKIDGAVLLMLTESDLRESMRIDCVGDVKRIMMGIERLRSNHKEKYRSTCTDRDVLFHIEYDRPRRISTLSGDEVCLTTRNSAIITDDELTDSIGPDATVRAVHLISREEIIRHVESPDTELKSLLKMSIALLYCMFSLLLTAFVMVVVHDRVPDMKAYPPLPDLVLDNLPLIPWAFELCEWIGLILCSLWLTILFFHKHRIILLRRMFSIVGTVFLLRCITMLITSLSVPGVHLECRAKSYGSLKDKLVQAFVIWSRAGMSLQGVRTCGDYMFSGHTTVVTLLNHFITEYTPQSWSYLHTSTWILNVFAIFFILAGHEHYSIDVFIAFYISSRMFLYYHAHAYALPVHLNADSRLRIWFPLGWFFESGSIGQVPSEFEMPFAIYLPRKWPWEKSSRKNVEVEMKVNGSNGEIKKKQNGDSLKKQNGKRVKVNKPKAQ